MRDLARRPATWMFPPLPYVLALWLAWKLEGDWAQHVPTLIPPIFDGPPWLWLGLMLIGLGAALFVWTLWAFWRHRTTVNPYQAARALITDGPFRFTRNPIYVGDWLVYVGVALWMGSVWPAVFAPLVWAIIRYGVIRHEEAHLLARFGDEYRIYLERVPRWF